MSKLFQYRNHGRLWRVYGRTLLRYSTPRKLLNALRTERAYRRRVADVASYPYILFLEPLYYCNLDCPLCDRQVFPDARPGKQAGKLSLDLFDKILAEAGDYLYQIQIYGQGEPLLDWARTRAIIQRAHARRIYTLMSTNCTLLTPQRADEIVTSGLDHLVCAIDGVSQQAYEQYRVGGSVEAAMAGMRNAAQAKRRHRSRTEIEWQFLIHKGNGHEIDQARKLAREIGVCLRVSPLRGMEFDAGLQSQWLPQPGTSGEADPAWQAGRVAPGQTVYDWPCYFLWRSVVLNSNGNAARCLIYQNVAEYASAQTGTFHELYNHPTVRRARELFRPGPVADGPFPAPCANCSFYKRHHGGPNLDKPASLAACTSDPDAGNFIPVEHLRSRPRRNAQLPPPEPAAIT